MLDHCDYEVNIIIVLALRLSVRHSSNYTQWGAVRKVRSTYSNYVRTTPKSVGEIYIFFKREGSIAKFLRMSVVPSGLGFLLRSSERGWGRLAS